MADFPDSGGVLTTLSSNQAAHMRLPPLLAVSLEVKVTLNPAWTADTWVANRMLTLGFLKSGASYQGPSVTFWNDGKMEGSDGFGDYTTGLPVMDGSTPNVYRIEWGPAGFRVYVDGVLYANPPFVHSENFLVGATEPLATAWADVMGYSPGGGDVAMTFDYIDIAGTGGTGPATEFWTDFLGSTEVV
jgi:hypothetical protein